MIRKWILLLLFSPLSLICFGQDKIDTDRPDQSVTPSLVPKDYMQVEIGFNRENSKNGDYVLVHPTTLLKYSGNNWIEWRLETNFQSHHQKENSDAAPISLFNPLNVGTKISLWEDKGVRPKTALLLNFSLPGLGKKKFKPAHIDPSLTLAMQNDISPKISIGYNGSAIWDGNAAAAAYFYALSAGFTISEKWNVYVENFATFSNGTRPDYNVDGGLAYFVNDNLKIDISGGLGLSSTSLKNYIAIGFSFRQGLKKQKT